MINIDMNTITIIIPTLIIVCIYRLRYVELNIVPNISCVANLGLVDIQVTLLGCQVDHHVQLYPFRSLKRWFALFEVQQVWEQFYLWPILLDINSIVKSSREGDYVHRRLWGTSHS